jgi:hypothetical protein
MRPIAMLSGPGKWSWSHLPSPALFMCRSSFKLFVEHTDTSEYTPVLKPARLYGARCKSHLDRPWFILELEPGINCHRSIHAMTSQICSVATVIFFPFIAICGTQAQLAPYRNLDFELADITKLQLFQTEPYLSGWGTVSDLLPYWHLSFGGTDVSVSFLNGLAAEAGGQSLLSKEAVGMFLSPLQNVVQGRYAMGFTVDLDRRFSLTQTGTVPPDAQMIALDKESLTFDLLEMRLGGTVIPLEQLTEGSLTLVGDVSAFAGQTAELELSTWLSSPSSFGNHVVVDNIRFIVPEPGTNMLLLLASFFLVFGCVRGRQMSNIA